MTAARVLLDVDESISSGNDFIMQKLRALHLYLGCVFAPLLLFFGISGIWQMLGLHSKALDLLSTIHTSHRSKLGADLASPPLSFFVLLMAAGFVLTTALGIVMALKHARSRAGVYCCLAFGVLFPVVVVLIRALR